MDRRKPQHGRRKAAVAGGVAVVCILALNLGDYHIGLLLLDFVLRAFGLK